MDMRTLLLVLALYPGAPSSFESLQQEKEYFRRKVQPGR